MARKRMIDPSFWSDEKLGECLIQERYLFMGLVSNADDEGYGRANPKLLKSSIFPYDDLRASDIEKWLSKLGGLNMVVLYKVNEQAYYYLPNFLTYQSINKPTESIYPKPDLSLPNDYSMTTGVLPPNRKEENRKEYSAFFESIWQLYPLKKGKGQVSDTQKEKLYKIGFEEFSRCIERYKKTKPDWQAYQNGSTFLNSGYVDYLDKNYKGPEPEQSKYPDQSNYFKGAK
jgi:hypothetical protein